MADNPFKDIDFSAIDKNLTSLSELAKQFEGDTGLLAKRELKPLNLGRYLPASDKAIGILGSLIQQKENSVAKTRHKIREVEQSIKVEAMRLWVIEKAIRYPKRARGFIALILTWYQDLIDRYRRR